MNCAHCGKPPTRYAAVIDSAGGPIGWGPKCARKVFAAAKRRARAAAPSRRHAADPRQVDWVGDPALRLTDS